MRTADSPASPLWGALVPGDAERRTAILGAGLAILRIVFGLIFLTNGLSKAFGFTRLPVLPGFLIDFNGAKGIIQNNVQHHPIEPYKRLVQDVMVPHWTLFGSLVTLGELSVGGLLVLGAFTPLAALAGLLMIFHIYFSRWGAGNGEFLWDYWNEFIPYLALALTSAGRFYGLDHLLAERYPALRRWPVT